MLSSLSLVSTLDRPAIPIAEPAGNLLLGALEPFDRALLARFLEPVTLPAGARIASSASSSARVCFPETLVASFGETQPDGERYEIGMIGCEGMIGWPVLLGSQHSPHAGQALLGGGTAHVMPAATLLALCEERRSLHAALLRFVQSFTVQMGQTIVANLRDGVEGRLARWLLMLHDRVPGDELEVTHGALAAALKVRRSSVTDRLHVLEGDHVVRCTRGNIVVRDRRALEVLAGPAYGPAEASYSALIAPFGKSTLQ